MTDSSMDSLKSLESASLCDLYSCPTIAPQKFSNANKKVAEKTFATMGPNMQEEGDTTSLID